MPSILPRDNQVLHVTGETNHQEKMSLAMDAIINE